MSMPSLLVEEQPLKKAPAAKQGQEQQQEQEQPPPPQSTNQQEHPTSSTPTADAMGSVTALRLVRHDSHQQLQQQPFYESFLESISNDIVQYLSKRNEDALRDDLTNLKESIASVTGTLIEFRNETGPVNTASMIQSIGWQVGASMSNMGCDNSSVPEINATATSNSQGIGETYTDYISTLTNLSVALTDRGYLQHGEPDQPVVEQVQSLTRALYLFGKCLYNGDYISQIEAIDTWNAEGDLQQATSEWEGVETAMQKGERYQRKVRKASAKPLTQK